MFFTSGITTVMTKYILMGRLNAYHVLTYTSLIGLIILAILNNRRKITYFYKTEIGWKWLLVMALSGFSVYEISFNIALQHMSATQTIIIYYLNPIFLYFASLVFLKSQEKKRFKKKVLIGIVFSFLGVYFVLTGGTWSVMSLNIGILYVLISIVSITVFTILGKIKDVPELQFLFLGQTISLISGICILWLNHWWIVPTIHELIYLGFIALFYNIINLAFYLKTIQFLSVEKLSTLTYISPIVTAGLAVAILNESLVASTIFGLLMVIVGNVIANVEQPS
jgi:drug/metabolite transporter (DMT)-like permease